MLQYWRTYHKWYVDGADFVLLSHIRVTGGGVEVISLSLGVAYLVISGFTQRLHTQLTASHIINSAKLPYPVMSHHHNQSILIYC